jgi:nitric oxide reductase activation protein
MSSASNELLGTQDVIGVKSGLIDASIVSAAVSASQHRVHLGDVQRVLALFTQGIAGHYLHLRPVEAAAYAREGVAGTQSLATTGATTDGSAIYLPSSVDSFASTRHNLGVYRIAILHQIGFFEFGTFAFSMQRARRLMPDLPAEPAWVADKTAVARFFHLWPAPDVMRRIFITLEDLRIDNAIRRHYPGARTDMARVLAHALAARQSLAGLNPVAALWERLVQFSLGATRADLEQGDLTDEGRALLASILDAAATVASDTANVYDTARAAVTCYQAIVQAGQHALADADDEQLIEDAEEAGSGARSKEAGNEANLPSDEDAFDEAGMGATQIDFRGDLNPEFIDDELIGGIIGSLDGDNDDGDKPPEKPAPDNAERSLRRATAGFRAAAEGEKEGARSFLYDEWDCHNSSYLKGWCRLFETRLQGDNHDFIREVHRQHATLAHQVKRRFKFIKPESLRRVRRVNDGEELELDGAIEAIIDRRAGHVTDDRVYSRRDRALREVSAAFLLDMSASTDYAIPDKAGVAPVVEEDDGDYPMHLFDTGKDDTPFAPPPEKRRVIDVARESLALMCEALGTLGDSHAIYGFSGQGKDNVEFYVAKEFEDKLTARTWAALAAMKAQRSTRMGPAIRHALAKLERQPGRMKVLIVVSDGYPQDFDYGPDRTDDEYGIQDTARALQEAETQGVHTFCITIDPSGHDYLRRMCRDNRYMVIDDVQDLPAELTKVYRALTV